MPSSEKSRAERYIVRTREMSPDEGLRVRHPLNPRASITMSDLSAHVGMARMHLHLARVPPGHESFVAHAHSAQEEFLFILDGEGELEVDGERAGVGPGDYIGFPVDGAAHNLRNTGTSDLVYLMGGERTATEVVHLPGLGKIGIWSEGSMRYIDTDAGEVFAYADFIASDKAD